ncbi:MMPL family transporter, partial [Asanoa sp. NPDC050611]|uniref:MMPL family transporter n=1 Tax=Asanoa sp. NPDC050611 TaxID=3157098 RepID=UPI0033CD4166
MWTERILRHRRLVMLGWLVLAVVGGALAPRAIDRLSYEFSFPGQPAYEANEKIQDTFGGGGNVDPLVVTVTLPAGRSFDDPGVRGELAAAFARLDRPGWRVASPENVADPTPFMTDRTAYALDYPPFTPGPGPYAAALPQLEGALAGVTVAGAQPLVTGVDPLNESGGGSDRPIIVEIALGAGGALVVLALAFGSLLALVPLLLAAVAITTTFLLVLALTVGLDVSFIVQYLVGLIGLGVAIDYALLIIMRWREERAAGADNEQAVRTAMATAGRAVVFSGVTVAISLLALIVLPLPFLRSVGLAGLLIPLVSVLVAVTLLPALLVSVGTRLEWPRRRLPKTESRSWLSIGRLVVRHRWVSAVLATAALVVLALPVFGLRLGSPELAAIAGGDSPAAVGYRNLADAGLVGALRPVEVVTTDPAAADGLAGIEGVAAVVTPTDPGWTAGDERLLPVLLT